METYYNIVQDTSGNIINGATITVYDSTGAVATIYNNDGSSLTNPFLSGLNRSEGEIEFAAESGTFDIRVVNGAETDWLRDITLFDPADPGTEVRARFDTVADMVASTSLRVGMIVETDGYTTSGDDGGNTYEIVAAATGTDDGGSYIDLDTHQAHGLFPNGKNAYQFGAVGDGSTDDTTAIQSALDYVASGQKRVELQSGSFAVSTMITVDENETLSVGPGVTIQRLSSLSSSTDPVIWLKSSGSSLIGTNRLSTVITTQNASPKGVVRIGFEDTTETGRIIRSCMLTDVRINGSTGDGKTSGSRDVCVYIPCGVTEVSYYHVISNIFCSDSNHGIWLEGESNGHKIENILGESLGNSSLDGALLEFNSGSDCRVDGAFMGGNGSGGSGAILLEMQVHGASSRSTHNNITGILGEMGVNGTLVKATDTGSNVPVSNIIHGVDNSGGNNVSTDFLDSNFTIINDYPTTKGGYRFPSSPSTTADANTLDYYAESQTYSTAPYIDSATAGSGRATTVDSARWTRIGNMCYVELRVTLSTLGTGGSGNVRIVGGAPFTSLSDSGNYLGGMNIPSYSNLLANVRTIKAGVLPGSTDIAIFITTGDATANGQMDFATYMTTNTQFYITGWYQVA
jgi:hypothetical protein